MATATSNRPPGAAERTAPEPRPRVLFLGKTYAGWQTRQLNLERHLEADGRIRPEFHRVTGWHGDGKLERLPVLGMHLKGRLRGILEARALGTLRHRPDVIWTSAPELLLPYLWTRAPGWRRPIVVELDWTVRQQEQMAREYFGRAPRVGPSLRLAELRERTILAAAARVVAMSSWAAHGVESTGYPAESIEVIHPGVDLSWWAPLPARHGRPGEKLKLLFVGGDFERKGGPELMACLRERFQDSCELDIVTRQSLPARRGVRVHRVEPNTSALRDLYQQADLFVLPTRADCFGHAAVEAMACGKPVIMTDVGGATDIVDDGITGWLLRSPSELGDVLEEAIASPARLREMGIAARQRAERLFDGEANDRRLADLLLGLAGARTESRARSS